MCGIIGYTGHRPAQPVVIEGLRRLEYRGYDSSGVAFVEGSTLRRVRAAGKLSALDEKLAGVSPFGSLTGIGHTRWATHGAPVEHNAHPHFGGLDAPMLAVVHNGIFENYREIREHLEALGYRFQSETDTEVAAHLIAEERRHAPDLMTAFAAALRKMHGAYALVMIAPEEPETIYAARMASPLIVGVGTGEHFVASDVPAFLPYTRDVIFLENSEFVRITPSTHQVFQLDTLQPVEKAIQRINWDMQSAQKGGYRHFMLKEIFEQPRVVTDCLAGRTLVSGEAPYGDMQADTVRLPELDPFPVPEHMHVVACGTSYHAGLWARQLFESWAHIPISPEIASEFHYREVLFRPGDVVLVISQSGETADTLAALRLAKARDCLVIGLCNVVGSSVAREADAVLITQAGPEISVASTKAMCSQMVMLALMALYYAARKGTLSADGRRSALDVLRGIPAILERILPGLRDTAKELAREFSMARSFFYLGRGQAFPLALEGALKLKELSYIHAEGYAAGEMKHGPIALIDPAFPSLVLAFNDALFPKTLSNMQEIKARGGPIIALAAEGVNPPADRIWRLPHVPGPLAGLVALPALQLFSYEMADYLGKDVDQPRNLAKSVTVE